MIRLTLRPARIAGNSGAQVNLTMGDGPATLTQGFGGMWEQVSRPKKRAITRFTGAEPVGQDVPILLDGFQTRRSVESALHQLLYQLQPIATNWDPNFAPPVWRIEGPIHFPMKRWIVSDIEFGDALRDPDNWLLIRQEATLKLIEYVRPDELRVKRLPLKVKPRKAKVGSKIDVKGETLRQIAVKYYGAAKYARPLGKGQQPPVRDVTKKLHRKIKLVRLTIP